MQPQIARQTDAMVATARALAQRFHIPTTFVKFIIVGGVGFLIYQGAFFLLYDTPLIWFVPGRDTSARLIFFTHPDIRLLIASVTAVEIAIVFQFSSHERWTFRARERRGWIGLRFLKFNASSFVSPLIVVATVNTLTPIFGISPYISNTIGVLLGVSWNWTINSLLIWPHLRGHEQAPGTGPAQPLETTASASHDRATS
jgi:putative flippase GtrA